MAIHFVVSRVQPLPCRYVQSKMAHWRQMEEHCLEEFIFIIDVLQYIEHHNEVKPMPKLWCALANVVTKNWTALALVPLKCEIIQIESGYLPCIRFLDLALNEAMAAADFRDGLAALKEAARQLLENLEASLNPEMVERRNREPLISHTYWCWWR